MFSHRQAFEQAMPGHAALTTRAATSLASIGRIVARLRTWQRNRRELRDLDEDQLNDAGLSRKQVHDACRLSLFG